MSLIALERLGKSVARSLTPPKELRYSDWAEENFRLSATSSAAPGRIKLWKFQRGILDAIGDPTIPRVSVIKSARTGYTVSLVASIGAFAVNDPSPMILLMPTDDDARGIAVDEIDPAFKESPALRGVMRSGRLDGRNTLTQRSMIGGGSLKILSARAPRNLRRHTAKILLADEVDGMEITGEGDPIKLAEKRTTSFADRKIVLGSTPTGEATSLIFKRYLQSDQRVFEIPCMRCGSVFELMWEHLEWKAGKPETVVCVCPHCAQANEENRKPEMVAEGEWRVTAPEVIGHAGFRLNALISQFANAAWPELVREFELANSGGASEMQVFQNTVLGRVFSEGIDYVSEEQLLAKVEDFALSWDQESSRWIENIPEQVAYITVGVDVQGNRLEATFIGHSPDQIFVLGHHVIYGDARMDYVWEELYAMLITEWKHPLGGTIGVDATAVDSGDGNMTQHVYDFCEKHQGQRIVAIKGVDGPKKWVEVSRRRRKGRRAPLYNIAVNEVKTHLQMAMTLEKDDGGSIRFSNTLSEDWFVQLASERRVLRYKQGRGKHERPKFVFETIGNRRHEALDCTTYGVAIAQIVPMKFGERYAALKGDEQKTSLRDSLRKLHS